MKEIKSSTMRPIQSGLLSFQREEIFWCLKPEIWLWTENRKSIRKKTSSFDNFRRQIPVAINYQITDWRFSYKFSFKKLLPVAINLKANVLIAEVSIFLSFLSKTLQLIRKLHRNRVEYREKSSTNYHKICVNVKAKFFLLSTNFNLNLSRHFYCYLSAPCVCVILDAD